MATQFIRSKVSKQKRRFVDKTEGFDLDLSYITPNIIAMGFPSEDKERFYRNPYSEVIRFLNLKHKDKFRVYNLCSERGYDPEKFYNRCAKFTFDDHNAPRFELIEELCIDVKNFVDEDPENVAVIHCKAGKGRTGLMICCWLLYNREWKDTESSMSYYAAMRTYNQKGVTIPSQIRYIRYFEERMKLEKWEPEYKTIYLSKIVFNGVPQAGKGDWNLQVLDVEKNAQVPWKPSAEDKEEYRKKSEEQKKVLKKGGPLPQFVVDCGDIPVIRDQRVLFKLQSQEILCAFWFNTWFIKDNHMHMEQPEIDRANKDKKNQIFPKGCSIDVYFKSDKNEKVEIAASSSSALPKEDGDENVVAAPPEEALNARAGAWAGEKARPPIEVVTELVEKAIALYCASLPPKQVHVTSRWAPTRNGEFREQCQDLDRATAELQKVSLEGLDDNELSVFWLNLVNLLYLHAFTVFGPSNSPTQREKMLGKASYNIGGKVYSLITVEQHMIRGNLRSAPTHLGALRLPKMKAKDKEIKAFVIKNPNPLLNFGIASGARTSPPLQVYRDPEHIVDQLKEQAHVYLHGVKVEKGGIVHVPALLDWYHKDFGKHLPEVVAEIIKLGGHDVQGFSKVEFNEAEWEFDYFFLHFRLKKPLVETYIEYYNEQNEEDKARKKEEMLAMMDEIDEIDEVAATEEENRRKGGGEGEEDKKKSRGKEKKKFKRSMSSKTNRVEKEGKEKRKKKESKARKEKSTDEVVGAAVKVEEKSKSDTDCEVCQEPGHVFCKTCDVHLCKSHLESEHGSIVLRKHELVVVNEESEKEEKAEKAVDAEEEKEQEKGADKEEKSEEEKNVKSEEEEEKKNEKEEKKSAEKSADESEKKAESKKEDEVNSESEEENLEDDDDDEEEEEEKEKQKQKSDEEKEKEEEEESSEEDSDSPKQEKESSQEDRAERRRKAAAAAIANKRKSGDPRTKDSGPKENGTAKKTVAADPADTQEAGQRFGVELKKPENKAVQEVESDARVRADTAELLKPENAGKKFGVNLRKTEEEEANSDA